MNRREFITKSTWILGLPLIIQQISCSDSDGDDGMSSDNGTTSGSFTINSSVDGGHSHSVDILYANVDTPPANDQTITSSTAGSHTHQITLTPTNYQSIKAGQTVQKTSTVDGGHSHTFSIKTP